MTKLLRTWALLPVSTIVSLVAVGCSDGDTEGQANEPPPGAGGGPGGGGSRGIRQIMGKLAKGPGSLTDVIGNELKQETLSMGDDPRASEGIRRSQLPRTRDLRAAQGGKGILGQADSGVRGVRCRAGTCCHGERQGGREAKPRSAQEFLQRVPSGTSPMGGGGGPGGPPGGPPPGGQGGPPPGGFGRPPGGAGGPPPGGSQSPSVQTS